jgi:hypothetical protein
VVGRTEAGPDARPPLFNSHHIQTQECLRSVAGSVRAIERNAAKALVPTVPQRLRRRKSHLTSSMKSLGGGGELQTTHAQLRTN